MFFLFHRDTDELSHFNESTEFVTSESLGDAKV